MEFYETIAWEVTVWTLIGCAAVTVVADWMRQMSARGTYGRYIWATVEHVTVYPMVVGVFLLVVENVAKRDWLWVGVGLATALYYVYLLVRFLRDNDDDWFNSGGPGRMLGRLRPGRGAVSSAG